MTKYYLLLLSVVAVLYGNTLGHGLTLDDGIYITNHSAVQKGVSGIGEILTKGSTEGFNQSEGQQPYRPATLISFALGKSLFDNQPGAEHLIQLLLFALLGILLFRLLVLWFPNQPVKISLFCTLLFLAHPVHTEVVANIKSRDELFAGLFGIASLVGLHRYVRQGGIGQLTVAIVCFILALLSKENAITLLGIIPLSLYFFEKPAFQKWLLCFTPFVAITAIYLLYRNSLMHGNSDGSGTDIINNVLNGATNSSQKFGTIAVIMLEYLRILLLPVSLSWDYSYNQIPVAELSSPLALFSIILHLALLVIAIIGIKKKSIFSFCILFYFITSSVTSNIFFLNGATLAERFLFLPSLAFCIAIPFLFSKILASFKTFDTQKTNSYLLFSCVGIIGLFGILTIQRNPAWKNNLSLFEAGVIATPNSARAHASLAYEYKMQLQQSSDPTEQQAFYQSSEKAFLRSLEIYPKYTYALYNIAVMYYEVNRKDEAFKMYHRLLAANPAHVDGNNNLGILYFEKRNMDSAQFYFTRSLKADPKSAASLKNLGAVYHSKNDFKTALGYYERSLAINPKDQGIYKNMILIYNAQGDQAKAKECTARMQANLE